MWSYFSQLILLLKQAPVSALGWRSRALPCSCRGKEKRKTSLSPHATVGLGWTLAIWGVVKHELVPNAWYLCAEGKQWVFTWPTAFRGPPVSQAHKPARLTHQFCSFHWGFPGAKEAHQIHAFFSVTYFNTFSSWFKNKNFMLPSPFQIPRNLIVFHEVSEIIASQPALPPSSPFVFGSDFATLDILRHIASLRCLSSLTIITLSILSAITLCRQAWLIRQAKPSFLSP